MLRNIIQNVALSLCLCAAFACASSAEDDLPIGAGDADHPALTVVKRLVGQIRYNRDERALEAIGLEPISRYLLGASYASASAEERTRFQGLLGDYIRLNAFPTARSYFKDIDISYEAPVESADTTRIRSSIVYAGAERVSFTWVLTRVNGRYVITDFLDGRGQSSMASSRDRQVQPLLRSGGMSALLAKMQELKTQLEARQSQ
jgi:ABC-type transporter MlaC component